MAPRRLLLPTLHLGTIGRVRLYWWNAWALNAGMFEGLNANNRSLLILHGLMGLANPQVTPYKGSPPHAHGPLAAATAHLSLGASRPPASASADPEFLLPSVFPRRCSPSGPSETPIRCASTSPDPVRYITPRFHSGYIPSLPLISSSSSSPAPPPAMATAAACASSLLAPPSSAGPAASSALFPTSVPSLRAYPRLLLAFRRPAAAAVADPQGAAVLQDSEPEEDEAPVQFDDVNDDYEDGYGGRGPAFTAPTRPRTGKAALPLKRDRTRSKRYLEIQKLRESKKEYDVPAALSLMKQVANTRFVESAEAHFRMNLDPKYNDQQLRATVNLPKGTGQTVKIAVLTQGEKIDEARAAGADIVGSDDLIEQIKGGFMEFDKLIASPDMMPKVASLGKILGPRGLMPNPKAGTVSPNITQAIDEFKKGKVEFRVDKTGIAHIPFGKVNFPEEDLIANFMAVVRSIERNKPSGAKGIYWKTAYVCSSMGPSIKLNIKEMLDYGVDSSN
ncbi:hypothetical protein ACQ4PT_061218 [Festuca glaucescens]